MASLAWKQRFPIQRRSGSSLRPRIPSTAGINCRGPAPIASDPHSGADPVIDASGPADASLRRWVFSLLAAPLAFFFLALLAWLLAFLGREPLAGPFLGGEELRPGLKAPARPRPVMARILSSMRHLTTSA